MEFGFIYSLPEHRTRNPDEHPVVIGLGRYCEREAESNTEQHGAQGRKED